MHDFGHEPVRAPIRRLMGVRIVATGSYVPDVVVSNDDLSVSHGFDPDWIVQRTGIRERRHVPPPLATGDMAVAAAQQCLARAGVPRDEIDLVVVGTYSSDRPFPSTACGVQDRLKLRASAMDVQAACAGFMYGLVTAMQYVANGCSRHALVIGADSNSRYMNPKDQRTYPLFGDGAGAVLVGAGKPDQGMLAYGLGADGSGGDLLHVPLGGSKSRPFCADMDRELQFVHMDGRAVFRWAVRLVRQTVRDVLAGAGISTDDVDLFILHQANIRIINAAADDLGIERERLFVNLDRYGNTSAGSIPLALDEAVVAGRVKRGHRIVLSGFGGGLAWGTALLRW